jgi:hypothetical protein
MLKWAARRREELLAMLEQLDGSIGELDRAGAGSGSDTSASKGIPSCVGCWWKRRRVRCVMNRKCGATICGWRIGKAERWRK